ncbi:glycoside hydrolase family 1 protein [Streptomyces spirodelae]|uniref:Family 1 glycosylhydrolase n=1 Tax=Streptomyces spirodelae TaxID=2812904 RepID=A0ABS3WMQ5_9ACTN|nr:family 1 glycosylhydrolase [Streptomyces spirodelae]MBO8184393.1 family 1 glycosylhydrolase [Streptomyces spirodelae]
MTTPQPLPVFPDGFLWGVATSAFQIEGAVAQDGRGPSSWDAFTREPGRIKDGSDATVATDHYHRWPEDVALLRELGVGAYRFSLSWPRLLPTGAGPLNVPGLDFYDRLVDALCEAGIQPVPTLFHWDTPLALEERGGWLLRDTARRFADYAAEVAARLGDRVAHWITLNEPAEVTLLGYGLGVHAPGKRLLFEALPAAHHQLLGHGLAVRALRDQGARSIGIANSHGPVHACSGSEADTGAADFYDTLTNRLFADPLLLGRYPEGLAELLPGPVDEDLRVIAEPLDWYGVNYYQPTLVGAAESTGGPADGPGDGIADGPGAGFAGVDIPAELPFALHEMPGRERTGFGWAVVPEGLSETLRILRVRYGDRLPPVMVTENGCAYPDRTEDSARIAFLDAHLRELHTALAEGIEVRGYFIWSLLDNFEWAEGRSQRFGLVHVDYTTLERTPRASFHWFRRALSAQRAAGASAGVRPRE